jgi:hypothetical protein
MVGNDQFKHTNPITGVSIDTAGIKATTIRSGGYGITTGRKPSRGKTPMEPVSESGCDRKG